MTICSATDLQATQFLGGSSTPNPQAKLNPYIAVDVDQVFVDKTSTQQKTRNPEWNDTFTTDLLRGAEEIGLTVRANLYFYFILQY